MRMSYEVDIKRQLMLTKLVIIVSIRFLIAFYVAVLNYLFPRKTDSFGN